MFSAATSASRHLDSLEAKTTAHLPQEIDATADYEGRDSCADDGEERDGADVLEEVPLKRGRARGGRQVISFSGCCVTRRHCLYAKLDTAQVHRNTLVCFFCFVFFFFLEMPTDCLNWSQ